MDNQVPRAQTYSSRQEYKTKFGLDKQLFKISATDNMAEVATTIVKAAAMDNSGQGPLRVSGFGGTSLYHELSMEDRFADNLCGWMQDPGLTVPEMAMLQLMSDLTDRDNWHTDILRDGIAAKWREEPGVSFSYDDWKLGRIGAPIRAKKTWKGDAATPPVPDHEFYSINLEDTFPEQGLQVIVRISSMELTPSQPSFTDNRHQDSLLNEHVVATAIYYYDIENVTESSISFRQRARLDESDYHYDRTPRLPSIEYEPNVFKLASMLTFSSGHFDGAAPVQELGSLSKPQGRLITWSNALQHRVEPFTLVDATMLGHRRFRMLALVDPHYRVCSTRNVPPQRQDWAGEALSSGGTLRGAGDGVVGGKRHGGGV
ncbi:hypothetical protein V500_06984 [Pseudogymnoascus sp. VKM F-4518 (FW-2643)]|nr:hypothetical protein V500_06984 [Pseudogymnoascus sp. VKM F-4518 (FW-2643)]